MEQTCLNILSGDSAVVHCIRTIKTKQNYIGEALNISHLEK